MRHAAFYAVYLTILFIFLSHLPNQNKSKSIYWLILLVNLGVTLGIISVIDEGMLTDNGMLLQSELPLNIWVWSVSQSVFQKGALWLALALFIRYAPLKNIFSGPVFFSVLGFFLLFLPGIRRLGTQFSTLRIELVLFLVGSLMVGLALSGIKAGSLFLSYATLSYVISDGFILIDNNKKIVDINIAAKTLLGLPQNSPLKTKDALSVFSSVLSLTKALEQDKEVELHTLLSLPEKSTYVHIRLFRLQGGDPVLGYLVVIRDDTERRKLSVARQNARDEMFSILHSITGAASRSENMIEFINAVMFQLSYSFRNTSTAIFLKEEMSLESGSLSLVAQSGIATKHLRNISFLDQEDALISLLIMTQSSLMISGKKRKNHMPNALREIFKGAVLFIPLFSEGIFVGIMIMSREGKGEVYRKDEIARIEIAAQQIGAFINKDRRLHTASTIAERQRVVRELHDSVTQRLYGLVMLTESIRAKAKYLNLDDENVDFIEDISVSTRQALREMRLFLYNLQPIDLRKGFSVVLLNRLEAVEGRSGIEVAVEIDENILLSRESEYYLYMIAEEALNNIIKHADATIISVALQAHETHYTLQIRDNGKGFSLEKASSGIGLRSMRERAALIGGKITMQSSLNSGSEVNVIVPAEISQQKSNRFL